MGFIFSVSLGNRKPQMRAGILMLLNVWLYNCPVAVSQLLQLDDTVQYLSTHIDECSAEGSDEDNQLVKGLMALLLAICLQNIPDDSEKKDSFNLLVERRIGKEVIAERIDGISRSEHYVRAAQRPQPTAKTTNEMLVDYRFAKLFKTLEGVALKMLRPDSDDVGLQPNESKSGVLASFKELIKRQDEEIASLAQQIKNLTASQNLVGVVSVQS
ncbi:hypothetical protein AB6A40_010475 [Gnathostoma spinigerum]|uniref:Vesicle tethering protein Uso1/P115-like head domain-containing protein n=1 Tax=Gnathostoma spinigerum TaxID=75299 RepID=A0ABD6EV58_9BILA